MTGNNGFFQYGDPYSMKIGDWELDSSWWSRHYEYVWALQFAEPHHVAADMGCGWMFRPFKDTLAQTCAYTYAVDADPRVTELPQRKNMKYIVADITKDSGIEAASLDRVFCISVLEDLGNLVGGALKEFARVVKPDGRIVITMDSQYDMESPLPRYPGVNMDGFVRAVADAGLEFDGALDFDKADAVYHPIFNLCCFHCVLSKA